MSLYRLQLADVVAVVVALALLVVMAADWYSTVNAEEARRQQELATPQGGAGGEIERRVDEEGRIGGEAGERNAWQADGAIDRVILAMLLAAYALTLLSAFLRSAGKRLEPPLTPAAIGALLACFGALLLAYRIWQEPGIDDFNTVQAAAPIAIVLLGVLSLALASAYRGEESGRAWRRMEQVEAPPAAT